jgi:uncharacterized membrane protein
MTSESDRINVSRGSLLPGGVGWALVAAGLIVNEWALGFFAHDGVVTGAGKLWVIVCFQVFCILAGIVILSKRWGRAPRPFLLAVGVVGAIAVVVASASWGIRVYTSRHNHTVHAGHQMAPTAEQRAWADEFYYRSLESAKRNGWFDFDNAVADGYVKMWKDRSHFQNEEFIFDDVLLDPDRPEFLMYVDQPEGKLLIGFMYFTRTLDEKGPELGGPLARWHFHPWEPRGMCAVDGVLPVGRPDDEGRCAEGERVGRSAEMLHVYFVDHPLGRFADGMIFPQAKTLSDPTLYHPFFVHFTLALFIISVLLDVGGRAFAKPAFHQAAWFNLVLSAIAAVATVVAGLAAEMNLLINADVHQTLTTHKQLGFGVLAAIVLLTVWRASVGGAFPARFGLLYLLLAIGGAGLTLSAGYYGADLVYIEGVAVQAIDREAIENHKYRVFNIYGRESAPAPEVGEGGWTGETNVIPEPGVDHKSHD